MGRVAGVSTCNRAKFWRHPCVTDGAEAWVEYCPPLQRVRKHVLTHPTIPCEIGCLPERRISSALGVFLRIEVFAIALRGCTLSVLARCEGIEVLR
jgi:hypothetical protein